MKTLKLFGKLLLAFILLFIFVDVMSFAYIASTYREVKDYAVKENRVDIQIQEVKTTNVNGYIKGTIKNQGDRIDHLYLGANCYSDKGNELDTVYTELSDLEAGQQKDFTLYYECQGVKTLQIYDSQEKPKGTLIEKENTPESKFALLVAGIALLICFG